MEKTCPLNGKPGQRLENSGALAKIIGRSSDIGSVIGQLLPNARPVRALIFDKNNDVNWSVPWHQDRVVAVKGKHDIKGFGAWTTKAGIWHTEPPIEILENMVFIRIHFDDCNAQKGALELALGSHKYGRIRSDDALRIAKKLPKEICEAQRGDVLIVKALTLHRSRKSISPGRRRALRVDYCSAALPQPLEWEF